MKKEEMSYLQDIKESEGLDPDNAYGEVKKFIDYQKGFKLLKRDCRKKDTRIKSLEKKIEDLTIKLRNVSVKNKPIPKSNSKLGKDIFKDDVSKVELLKVKRFIIRIKSNIEDNKKYTKTSFIRDMLIPKKLLGSCIINLKKEGFLAEGFVDNTMKYWKK